MSTRALQIRDAIAATLKATPVGGIAATRVFVDMKQATDPDAGPFIVVELGDEPPPEETVLGYLDRTLDLRVTVIGAGADPVAVIDPAVAEIHARIAADLTQGGLSTHTREGARTREREDLDRKLAAHVATYHIDYRTGFGSLET